MTLEQVLSTESAPVDSNDSADLSWLRVATRALLAALPVVLALAAYYPAQLRGKPFPSLVGDASLYDYQLMRPPNVTGSGGRSSKTRGLVIPTRPSLRSTQDYSRE